MPRLPMLQRQSQLLSGSSSLPCAATSCKVSGENARWFVYSGIFVAAAHGFLYSALAVAPIMLVAPLLQLSLVFRFLFALILNPHHEIFGFLVVVGTSVSIVGACAIAIDTQLILDALAMPEPFAAALLRSRL